MFLLLLKTKNGQRTTFPKEASMPARCNARVSLCSFTFSDGRHCRTPRSAKHPHLCYFHARKESQARAAEQLGAEIFHFFSGRYLSACDLSSAIGRLFVGVVDGNIKPRTARTLAYLAQTLLQSIHLAEHEYIETFGSSAWHDAIVSSVNSNYDFLFPPDTPEAPSSAAADAPDPEPEPDSDSVSSSKDQESVSPGVDSSTPASSHDSRAPNKIRAPHHPALEDDPVPSTA
jgi:hypothetical protein